MKILKPNYLRVYTLFTFYFNNMSEIHRGAIERYIEGYTTFQEYLIELTQELASDNIDARSIEKIINKEITRYNNKLLQEATWATNYTNTEEIPTIES